MKITLYIAILALLASGQAQALMLKAFPCAEAMATKGAPTEILRTSTWVPEFTTMPQSAAQRFPQVYSFLKARALRHVNAWRALKPAEHSIHEQLQELQKQATAYAAELKALMLDHPQLRSLLEPAWNTLTLIAKNKNSDDNSERATFYKLQWVDFENSHGNEIYDVKNPSHQSAYAQVNLLPEVFTTLKMAMQVSDPAPLQNVKYRSLKQRLDPNWHTNKEIDFAYEDGGVLVLTEVKNFMKPFSQQDGDAYYKTLKQLEGYQQMAENLDRPSTIQIVFIGGIEAATLERLHSKFPGLRVVARLADR